jgi:hypothetical protein
MAKPNKPTPKKPKKGGVVQGYTGTQLQDDLATLAQLATQVVYDDGEVDIEYDDDITKLVVGRACANVKNGVDRSLEKLFEKLKKLLPLDVVQSVTRYDAEEKPYQVPVADVQYKMGPLKKVSRVAEKAAHYAICSENNYDKPQLQRVCDILRATMVFPPAAWMAQGIGSMMIDAVNDHFKGKVVQVKNRFIHQRYPNFSQLDGVVLPEELDGFIARTFKQTLWGRDSFYRDLQLLVRIDADDFDNGQDMTYVMLELQLASSRMYSGKTDKSAKGGSGHDMYKNVRAVMEYCEFLWWKARHDQNGGIKLPKAASYYNVAGASMTEFAKQAEQMSNLYKGRDVVGMDQALSDAIEGSQWAKTVEE